MCTLEDKISAAMTGVKRTISNNEDIPNKKINLNQDDEENIPFADDQEEDEPLPNIPMTTPQVNENFNINSNSLIECVTGTQIDFPNTEDGIGETVKLISSTRVPPIEATAAYIRKYVLRPDEDDDTILSSNSDDNIKFEKQVFNNSSDTVQVLSYLNELAYTNNYVKYINFERIKLIGIDKGMKNNKFELSLIDSKGAPMNDTLIVLSNGIIENLMMGKKDSSMKFPNLHFKSKIRHEIVPVTRNPAIASQIRGCNLYKIMKINRLGNSKIFYKNGKEITKFSDNFKFNLIAGYGTFGPADRGKLVDENNVIVPNQFDNRVFPSFNLILAIVDN